METSIIRLSASLLAGGLSFLAFTGFPPPGNHSAQPEATRAMMEAVRTNPGRRNFELALPPAQVLHKLYPQNHIYIEQLATVFNGLRRFPDEAAMWELYLLNAPVPLEACPQVGVAWRAAGMDTKAVDALKRCLVLEPNNPDVIYQLGYTFEHSAPETAEAWYRLSLRRRPENADLLLGLGRISLTRGRTQQAASAALHVLEQSPDNTDAMLLAGLALTRLNRLDEAQAQLARGAALSPQYTDMYLALADVAERRHDLAAATRYYQQVLQLSPEHREASFALERIANAQRAKSQTPNWPQKRGAR